MRPYVLILLISTLIYAQQGSVAARVTVNYEKVADRKNDLDRLQERIENYVTEHTWSRSTHLGTFQVNIDFTFLSYQRENNEDVYTITATFSAPVRKLELAVPSYRMNLRPGSFSGHSRVFRAAESLVDYHIQYLIGVHLDSEGIDLGKKSLQEATQIARQGELDSYYSAGWKGRRQQIEDLVQNDDFRHAKPYFYWAFKLRDQNKLKTSTRYLDQAMKLLGNSYERYPNDRSFKRFVQVYYQDVTELALRLDKKKIFEQWRDWDPESEHQDFYSEKARDFRN